MPPDGEIRASHWRVLGVCVGALAALAFVGLLFGPEARGHTRPGEEPNPVGAWLMLVGVTVWALYAVAATAVNRLRLTADRVERRNIFGLSVVNRADVVGVREVGGDVYLCTDLKRTLGMGVSPKVLEHPVWAAWIETLLNLDQQDRVDEQARQEADESLGRNIDERRQRVLRLNRIHALIGFVILALGFWALIWPRPYELAIAIMVLTPIVCGVLLLSRVLVVTTELSSLAIGVAFPPLVLAARASVDLQLLDTRPSLILAGIVAVFGAAISAPLFKTERWGPALLAAALFGVLVGMWTWSSLAFADVLLDKAPVRVIETTVLEREDQDKDAKFVLQDRGPSREVFKASTGAKRVPGVGPGDQVCLLVYPGRLGWRWGVIRDCASARAS